VYVEVAVNLPPVQGTFHYHLPPELSGQVRPGHLVTVPFGSRRLQGVVIATPDQAEVPETRPVEALLDPEPVLTPAQLELARWLAQEYAAPLNECLTLMLPPGLSQQADSLYTLTDLEWQPKGRTQRRILEQLRARGPLRGRQLARALGRVEWQPVAERMVRAGVLSRSSVLQPPRVSPRTVRTVRLAVPAEQLPTQEDGLGKSGTAAPARRLQILQLLAAQQHAMEVSWVYKGAGANLSDLRFLEDLELVELGGAEVWRDPLVDVDFVPSDPPELTPDQQQAWEPIRAALEGQPGKPFLLHGVTGSGKTEIYLRAAGMALEHGRGAIVLVPEIALTPQTVRRFLARFPGRVGVIHSQLSEGERYDTWRRARTGELPLIVGPRSALFVPLPSIGLIAVDECHDESYKEHGQDPRYHAREAALSYARILGAVCVLGSATPEVVTTYRAARGELQRLSLPQRILGHRERIRAQAVRLGVEPRFRPAPGQAEYIDLPPVQVIDMRQELRAGNRSLFSRALQASLGETLQARQQAILFLNRRGTATYVFCRDCGEPLRCSRCDTPLTYHGQADRLQCHHCGNERRLPTRCPNCGSQRIRQFGAGTQRIQAEVEQLFPGARTIRWDRDTTRGKGAHADILAHFASQRSNLLIGTQMVAKGLDLPLVTLVGVISADIGLNLPDYRAAERTFQVLTQVAGRAGRGLLGGHVILQTFQPEHYAIQAAAAHDYQAFYRQELELRRSLDYPPFSRLVKFTFQHRSRETAQEAAERLASQLRALLASQQGALLASQQGAQLNEREADLIGPVPAFFMRLAGEYRWMVVLRAREPAALIPSPLPRGWVVDVDPVSLL
jgi:primosomal protein N' (replication factor Y)